MVHGGWFDRRSRARLAVAGVALTVLASVAGCGGGGDGGGGGGGKQIKVWTLENLPDRLAAQKRIAAAFTKAPERWCMRATRVPPGPSRRAED